MKMFAVVAKEHEEEASVKLMSDSRKGAIGLWEHWNPSTTFKAVSESAKGVWKVKRYDVNLLKR